MIDDPDAPAAPDAGIFGLNAPPEACGVVLVPAPFEATVSYGGGTAGGPEAIVEASKQIDLFDLETGRPYEAGIAMLETPEQVREWNRAACAQARPVVEAGGVENDPAMGKRAAETDRIAEALGEWIDRTSTEWLERGKLVGTVGGDHSVAFGSIAAHARACPGMGILHVDAHADLRDAYEGFRWSHASIFFNVRERLPEVARVVGVGFRDLAEAEQRILEEDDRFVSFDDPGIRRRLQRGSSWATVAADVVAALPRDVYVSFDIDGLDPSLCPSTGTPVPGGLSFPEATSLLAAVVESGRRIVGFDLCEVAPGPTEWDANVGARILYKLIGFALRSRA